MLVCKTEQNLCSINCLVDSRGQVRGLCSCHSLRRSGLLASDEEGEDGSHLSGGRA